MDAKPHSLGAGFILAVDEHTNHLNGDSIPPANGQTVAEPDAVKQNGRTYHGFGDDKYLLPNDGEEQGRLDTQHQVFVLLMDGELHWSPVSRPEKAKVLDIGTGTGKWAIEYAKQYPGSQVTGTDLSAIQPKEETPSNVQFKREDSENVEWTYSGLFDLVHLRMTFTCFRDPSVIVKKAFDSLQPGGWIEFQEFVFDISTFDDSHLTHGAAIREFVDKVNEGMAANGVDVKVPKQHKEHLQAAGFVDVTEQIVPCPGHAWPRHPKFKTIGHFEHANMQSHVASGAMTRAFEKAGLLPEEIESLTNRTLKDLEDADYHWWMPVYVVYGRKPVNGESNVVF